MKVFPDSTDAGANEGVILAALEDALLLGADVVNLSLGSDNCWAEDDTAANHAYERMNAAGLTFMVSAGNSGDSTYNNQYGDHTLTADPETSMISAPAVYGYAIPASQFYFTNTVWNGTDLNGNTLPSGTNCVMTITVWGDGEYGDKVYADEAGCLVHDFDAVASGEIVPTFNGHEMDLTGDVLEFPVVIDTVAPKLENNTVSFYEEDGRVYMTGTVYDEDGSLASVEVHPYVKRTHVYQTDYFGWDIDQLNPFYTNHVYDPATKTLTFTCDVTEYAHTNESYAGESSTYTFEWDGTIFLSCGDYGLNDRTYVMKVDTGSGIRLSQTSALMYVGGEFELSVLDNTGTELDYYGTEINVANYTPAEPGLSILKATTRDGSRTVHFAVVSEPVLAEKLTLAQKELTLSVGQTGSVEATLSPEPTEQKHAQVKWESFDPAVATVLMHYDALSK